MNENNKSQQPNNQTPQSTLPANPSITAEESVGSQEGAKTAEQRLISRLYPFTSFRWFTDFWKRDWQRFIADIRKLSSGERLAFYVTFVGLLGAALTIRVLTYTLQEMQSGSEDTHELAIAAKIQAQKMQSMSTAADKIRKASEDMVGQDQRIADSTQKAMNASNTQSKTALDATIAASALDERAWIGIGAFRVIQFDKDGFKVDIEMRNSGKTPALDVSESAKYGWNFSLDNGPQEVWFMSLPGNPAEAIPPGGSHINHLIVGADSLAPGYDSIKSKAYRIYVFGRIKYTDISRHVNGVTDFCFFMSDPDKHDLSFCRNHNDMK